MKAAYFENFGGPVSIESLDDPVPTVDGVVLKVLASGLCLSDWHGWKGHDADISLPHVPGHELAGEIVEVGKNVKDWKLGQRVTLPFVCGCGRCPTCSGGDPQVCPDQFQPGFTQWGSFAELVSIRYANFNLVAIPESISNESAAILGCRFATSFRGIVHQGGVRKGQQVAVFGCGGVGLSAIMIAKARGAFVIAIDRKQAALEKALESGADAIVHTGQSSPIAEIHDLSNGGVHVTVDAIGHPQILKDSVQSLRRRGRHIQIGLLDSNRVDTIVPMERVIAYELELFGSHGMQAYRYPEMIQMIEEGLLRPNLLIDGLITLEEAVRALPNLHRYEGSGVRVINRF